MASILSAAAKSVSTGSGFTSAGVSTPPTAAASAPRFRRFGGSLVQPLVQQESAVAATSDRLTLGTLCLLVWDQEVAGSNPVAPISEALPANTAGKAFFV